MIFKHFRRLFRPLLQEFQGTFLAALLTVTGVGLLLVLTQGLLQAPVVPNPVGLVAMMGGLLPATLALALPVAALVAAVATGRSWAEGGELQALGAAGLGRGTLLAPILVLGLGLGAVQLMLAHQLEPRGRAHVRGVLSASLARVQPRPGEPVRLGEAWLSVEAVDGGRWTGVVLAQGDHLVAASGGHVDAQGTVHLSQGVGMSLGDGGGSVRFAEARLTVPKLSPRVELVERSGASLRALIVRMQAEGRTAASERMALLKRTIVPLSVPLLIFLGLPLGARGVRPGAVALSVVLGWWVVMRLCDQRVHQLGPELAAGAPAILLAACAMWAWGRWR